MVFPAYTGRGNAEDANARITITIKSSPRGAARESIKIVPTRGENCVYGRAFDSLGRQIQMTSEAHVTISAAQRGGMHPFARLALPSFSHGCASHAQKKAERKIDGGKETR